MIVYTSRRLVRMALYALVWWSIASNAFSEGLEMVYFVAGNPVNKHMNKFPVHLFKLVDGNLSKVLTIFEPDERVIFVRSYQDKKMIVVGSQGLAGTFLFSVIRLGALVREVKYRIDSCPNCSFGNSYLLARGHGELVLMLVTGKGVDGVFQFHINGIGIDSGDGIELSLRDYKSVYSVGASGGNVDGDDYLRSIYPNHQHAAWGYKQKYRLGWELPKGFDPGERIATFQMVNTEYLRVITGAYPTPSPRSKNPEMKLYVENKLTSSWTSVSLPGDFLRIRGFSQWIATEESYHGFLGSNKPNQKFGRKFLTATERDQYLNVRQTGRLFLYDSSSGITVTVATGNPDSEVLLVKDGLVYIRVADEIRVGKIVGDEVQGFRTIASSPNILPVHWMVAP